MVRLLTGPDEAKLKAERKKGFEIPILLPAQWLAVAVIAGGMLLGVSKLFRNRRPQRQRNVEGPEQLPTHVLVNSAGVEVHISPVGCAIERLLQPDKHGKLTDVVLGFDKKAPYLDGTNPYFGVVVGRCANRIANASFEIDGKRHRITANDGKHSLHGGRHGWGQQVWDAEKMQHADGPAVRLTYTSRSGEEGYPGTVKAMVTYILTDGPAKSDKGLLRCVMEATTDAATPVNMAQHSYWNLAGHDSGDILSHNLTINGDYYTPVDDTAIPTGELESVKGTPFDFLKPHPIGARIAELPGGYDHNFVISRATPSRFTVRQSTESGMKSAAVLHDPGSGRLLELSTTAPGLQFYSGNFLDGVVGKGDTPYHKHAGLALESQGFPNSINQPQFPSVLLRPDEAYRHEVQYSFRTK